MDSDCTINKFISSTDYYWYVDIKKLKFIYSSIMDYSNKCRKAVKEIKILVFLFEKLKITYDIRGLNRKKSLNICIITFLFSKAFIPPLSNLEKILCSIGESELYVIEGCFENLSTPGNNKIKKYRILYKQKNNLISRIMRLFYLQLKMSIELIKLSKNIDICIFFTGQWEILPLLTAKLLNKKVLWLLPSYLPHIKNTIRIYPLLVKFMLIFKILVSFYQIKLLFTLQI